LKRGNGEGHLGQGENGWKVTAAAGGRNLKGIMKREDEIQKEISKKDQPPGAGNNDVECGCRAKELRIGRKWRTVIKSKK
jgi:hypothetical protein